MRKRYDDYMPMPVAQDVPLVSDENYSERSATTILIC